MTVGWRKSWAIVSSRTPCNAPRLLVDPVPSPADVVVEPPGAAVLPELSGAEVVVVAPA
jgi:hypothetical protein